MLKSLTLRAGVGVVRGPGLMGGEGGTYLGVDNFVPAERAGLAKAFTTDFAHERSGSGVNRHVAGEVIVSVKHLWKDNRVCTGRGPTISPRRPWFTSPNQHLLQKLGPFVKVLSNLLHTPILRGH
jgi:hypothetical protein